MKQCTKCKQAKPLDEYQRNPKSRDNRSETCKVCQAALIKKRNEEIKYRKQFEIV